jgi:ADP-ribose pyrophosphatase YjhB (NUDIX family)
LTARKRTRRGVVRHVRVEVRAVILVDRKLVVQREQQADGVHVSLPGGRVQHGEPVLDALVREVDEETGLTVTPGRLLYVAEVNSRRRVHDVNLVFLAEPVPESINIAGLDLLDLDDATAEVLRPPLIEQIRLDITGGWTGMPRWLGNVWEDGVGSQSATVRGTSPP